MSTSGSRRTNNKGRGKLKYSFRIEGISRSKRYNNNQPRRDFAGYSRSTATQVVSTVFRESVHQILEKN